MTKYCSLLIVCFLNSLFPPSTAGALTTPSCKRTLEKICKTLKDVFVVNSSLNFMCERRNEGKFPFLENKVKQDIGGFQTKVYVKHTNLGQCLNGESECP